MITTEQSSSVVVDLGSHSVKAGLGGEDAPTTIFPSDVGLLPGSVAGPAAKPQLVMGTEELAVRRDHMPVRTPFDDRGAVENWEILEALLRRVVEGEAGLSAREQPLLLSQPMAASTAQRERLLSLCFESLGCPAVFLAKAPVLAAFAMGQQTALVIESGHSSTTVTPVHEGFALARPSARSSRAGLSLSLNVLQAAEFLASTPLRPRYTVTRKRAASGATETVVHEYLETDPSYRRWSLMEVAEGIKEQLLTVSETPLAETECSELPSASYTLPDGSCISMGKDRAVLPEALFTLPDSGVGHLVRQCVQACDEDIRASMCKSMLLVGGTTLLRGYKERLENEVKHLLPSVVKPAPVLAASSAAERKNAVWMGGSILSSLGSFQQLWVSQADFKESGASVVHRRCP
eukprot:RCo045017